MKLAILKNTYNQYGPNDYEPVTVVLLVTEATTVGEILDWERQQRSNPSEPFNGPVTLKRVDEQ